MISPKLLDFSPFFFLISSRLGTEDFLVLLELSGDGYSLLCSKNSLRGTVNGFSKVYSTYSDTQP
jgi:hypothetical protein